VKRELDVTQQHLSLWGRGRPKGPGEGAFRQNGGAFNQRNCAIWNDIRRALEGNRK
jgi:hypothetical protein